MSSRKNQRFQIGFAEIKAIHVRTDNAELFSLFGTQFTVHSSLNLLNRCFDTSAEIGRNIKWLITFQQSVSDGGCSFAKHI